MYIEYVLNQLKAMGATKEQIELERIKLLKDINYLNACLQVFIKRGDKIIG